MSVYIYDCCCYLARWKTTRKKVPQQARKINKIGVFDIKHQKWWKLLSGQGLMTYCSSFVSSSNGDILLTAYADHEEYKRFWKFDSLENRWIEVWDRNVTIFVGGFLDPTCNHISFSVSALGNAGEFAGKICRIEDCHRVIPHFCSFVYFHNFYFVYYCYEQIQQIMSIYHISSVRPAN